MSKIPKNIDFVDRLKKLEERLQNIERSIHRDHAVIVSDKKLYLDGETGDAYITYNSSSNRIEFYISGTLEGFISTANTGTQLQNV